MNQAFFITLATSRQFNQFIIGVILLAGIVVGFQTYHAYLGAWNQVLELLDIAILVIFTVELAIKLLAEGNQPLRYFKDPWNVFDFTIVAVCWCAHFIPEMNAGFVAVIRLARILRVLRLVHVLPQLKLLIDAMLKSIPSMGYVGILLLLLFYIYGAMGVFLFGGNDPLHFANLHTAMLSLFRISTLEGWTEIMYVNMYGCDNPKWGYGPESGCTNPEPHGFVAVFYFVTFVLIGTMIVLNLFIGVIMNAMDEVRCEQELEDIYHRKSNGINHISDDIHDMHHQLDAIKKQLDFISFRLKKGG